jgi:hypothetical protein
LIKESMGHGMLEGGRSRHAAEMTAAFRPFPAWPDAAPMRFRIFIVRSFGNERNTEVHLSDHRFKVGQSVKYGRVGPRHQLGSSGVYQVTQLLPFEGNEWLYRIKSLDEPNERVAKEAELERVTGQNL